MSTVKPLKASGRKITPKNISKDTAKYSKTLEIILKHLPSKSSKILDIGSAPCHLLFCMKYLGYKIVGVDIAPERVKDFITANNLEVIKCNIETQRLPFKNNTFDAVIFTEVFEHLRIDPIFALEEINRVLKPNGLLFFSTPNFYSLGNIKRIVSGKGFNDAFHEFMKLRKLGHMGHIREYTLIELRKFLNYAGFEIVEVHRFHFGRNKLKSAIYKLLPRFRPFFFIVAKKISNQMFL